MSTPTPCTSSRLGAVAATSGVEQPVDGRELLVEGEHAPAEDAHRGLGCA